MGIARRTVATAPAKPWRSPATVTRAQQAFLRWIQREHPQAYQAAIARVGRPPGATALHGLGLIPGAGVPDGSATSTSSSTSNGWFQNFTSALTQLGTAYLGVRAQDQLIKLNIERAKQGLDPLTAQQTGAQPSVAVDVRPSTGILAAGAGAIGLPVLLIGAGVAWYVLGGGSDRRRR